METFVHQIQAFAATIVIGVVTGFCYDYYRAVRRTFRLRKFGSLVGDILFWLVTTGVVFALLLRGNWGELRLYVFIGLGLGALLYTIAFSHVTSKLIRYKFFLIQQIWTLLVRLAMLLWGILLFPFRLVLLILSYPLNFLRGLTQKARQKLKTVFYNLVGHRIKRVISGIKSGIARLAFWRGIKK